MQTATRLTAITGLVLAATATLAAPASAAPDTRHHGAAVFVQSDDPAGNTVAAYDRWPDGTLRPAATYATGGLGGVLTGAVVDHLASQGSLTLDRSRRHLFAVNAGSDTVTVFGVRGDRLDRRQVVTSGGSFPVSVAVHGRLVYVLNARDGGSVQGYRWDDGVLRPVPAWHRSLGLDPTQTPEFTHTPGQVAFSPDGRQLVVTTKAGANSVVVFGLDRSGAPAGTPVTTVLAGAVPFAVDFDRYGHLLVAEAGPSAVATFALRRDGTLTALDQVATGQAATCWIAGAGGYFYASNAGSASVSGFRTDRRGALDARGNTGTDPGTIDAASTRDGRYLYVQTGREGTVNGFRVGADGSLVPVGTVTVPGGVGGEGIAAS
ncbi:lactonase family protein [Micromonospora sp. NPDC000089]|uniref:lactonase family protein n=1 Tax=unclassified Micromonospora TaxID=2617518 RepID=UPI00368EC8A9